MDIRTFIASLVSDVLSWPVLVLVLVLILRQPVQDLIGRIRSYEGLGQKVTFGDELNTAEITVENAVAGIERPKGEVVSKRAEMEGPWADLARDAEQNPSFAVIRAWEMVSGAVDDLVGSLAGEKELSEQMRHRRPQTYWLDYYAKQGRVDGDFAAAVHELRALRNRVAHGQHNPTAGEAVAYLESAKDMSDAAHLLAGQVARVD